jgi:predicted acyltransferase
MSDQQTTSEKKPSASAVSGRMISLDVFRGFIMFWIIGNDSIGGAFEKIHKEGGGLAATVAGFFAKHLEHPGWEGLVFYDLIFPGFIFIIGISLVFSLSKIIQNEGKAAAYKRLIRRFLLLFFLAFIYDEGFANIHDEDVICGVLQRLSLCYLFTGLLFINLNRKGLIAAFVILLGGYWALLSFVPIPGQDDVSFKRHENWNDYIGENYSPYKNSDPEGYLSTLPAICSCLLGVFTAFFLRNKEYSQQQKVLYLLGVGVAMTVIGYLWSYQFPIVKRLWSPSYVFAAGGYCFIMLAAFSQIVDIWKIQWWTIPFIWLGSNAITVYMSTNIIDYQALSERFVGGDIAKAFGVYDQLIISCGSMALSLLLVRWLYKRKLFIRV